MYNGGVDGVREYFAGIGLQMPHYMNPAEFIIEKVNIDFDKDPKAASKRLREMQQAWEKCGLANGILYDIQRESNHSRGIAAEDNSSHRAPNNIMIPLTLVHRNFIKSYRDIVAYGIRIAMYMGLAIMMGTVWLRLTTEQKNINAFTNAIVRPAHLQVSATSGYMLTVYSSSVEHS